MNLYLDTLRTLQQLLAALRDPRTIEGVEAMVEADTSATTSSLGMALGQLGLADAPESTAPFWETDGPRPA